MAEHSWRRVLGVALLVNLLAVPAMSILIAMGWLDRFSGGGSVTRNVAHVAVWSYGSLSALLLAYLRFRPAWSKLVLAAVSVALCLALIEVAGRVLRIPEGMMWLQAPPSASLHHAMPANTYMLQSDGDVDIVIKTNDDRLRTPYSREDFTAFTTRIAVLGDSFTLGFFVAEDEAYPARLESRLRESRPDLDVAVLNAGTVSYSPIIESRQMEQVVAGYKPQLVILMFDMTDIGDDIVYGKLLRSGPDGDYFDVPERRAPSYSGVVGRVLGAPIKEGLAYPIEVVTDRLAKRGLLAPRPEVVDPYYPFELEIGGVVETNKFFIYRHPLELTRPYFEATWTEIVAAAESADRIGAAFALVVSPRFHHWNPAESPNAWDAALYGRDPPFQFEYRRFFDEARERVDFPIIDLLPDFQATDEFPLVFDNDPHWNSAGHDFAARVLLEHLAALGLIPG